MATGEPIKHFRELERLLTAIYCPKEVAVMYCKRHSRDASKEAKGNQTVKPEKRHFTKPLTAEAFDLDRCCEQEKPQYTEEELERYEKRGTKMPDKGWVQSEDGQLVIPEIDQWKSFSKALELTNHVTQLSAFQQALTELWEMTPDPV